jgi:NADPH:quinone reductase-like Zn-dependent oxidoreductase
METGADLQKEGRTVRVIRQDAFGGPEVLKMAEAPCPEPGGPTRVLVRVKAAGLNPTDWKHRARRSPIWVDEPPFVLGWDVSGVIEATGPGVTIHRPGDEVFGMLPYPHEHGAFAEYAVGPARAFVAKPAELDHVQAAAVPMSGLTAWQALVDTAGLSAGQRVLIHAAGGGVGHMAVQIAKARGAHVTGTASAGKHGFLYGLGADELIDYTCEDFAKLVRNVDVVIDTIGGDYGPRSLETMRSGGVIVNLVPPAMAPDLPDLAAARGLRCAVMTVEADHACMAALAELVASGRLRPETAAVLPLKEAARAHELGEAGHTTGKIVLTTGS